ncbi:hypothetical protein KY359_01890 [Candidatus Woesearchaeota archaeon]|nr:hypothetical protein [Candidatus Woesearchaeota archaeon]
MLINGQKINKEEFLAIKSEITDVGITISVKNKKYRIEYPAEIWQAYSETNRELLLDNLTFMQTCHLPASHKKKGAVYSTSFPLFETFAFESTMYDIPSTAVIDKEKTSSYMRKFFNSNFLFSSYDTVMPHIEKKRKASNKKKQTAILLFTAGKESLLTLALCMELGITPVPIYMNENPAHPETKHKEKIIKTIEDKYGIKVHKILNESGKLRYCDLGEEDNNWGAGTQFLTYVLLTLPFVQHYDADYILFGNEYSCDDFTHCDEGFKSNFCFDQCSEWTKQLNIVTQIMTNGNVEVGSLVGPLYEIGLIKILHERYPQLAKLQMSCFSDTEEGKSRVWCGNCSKCARMFVFFKALGMDTGKVGFENNMFNKDCRKHFSIFGNDCAYSYDISGLGEEEQTLAFFMASARGETGYLIDEFKKLPAFAELSSNFKKVHRKYFSQYENVAIPYELRERVMDIFDESYQGKFEPKDFRLKHVIDSDELEEKAELIKEPQQ